MKGRSAWEDVERAAPWLAAALIGLPVFVAHYPPMVDLPLHEAAVGLLRHWGDPAFVPPNIYALNVGLPNQLFYFLILFFSFVLPIGVACKIVVGLTLLSFPLAVGRLADHLRVTRVTALLLAPIGLGWMFFWGLLANMIGLSAYLFALPSLDRFCARPSGRGLKVACGWIVFLHFAHELMGLVAAGTLVLFVLASWKGWRDNALRLLPAGLALALAASAYVVGNETPSKMHTNDAAYPAVVWASLSSKLDAVIGALYSDSASEWWVRYVVFAACQAAVVLLANERWKTRSRGKRALRQWLFDFRFEILGASLVVLYLVSPDQLRGTTRIYRRFLPPAWILLTMTACARGEVARFRRLPRIVASVAPLVPLLMLWPDRFVAAHRMYSDFDAAIATMEPNSTYAVLHVGPMKDYSFDCLGSGGHIVGALGGRSFFDYTQSESAPVFQRVDAQWNYSFQRVGWTSYNWMPPYDMKRYRYVVLHATETDLLDVGTRALQPEGRLLFRQGDWAVVESTLPLVPIDAPDEPTPPPYPMLLGQRFAQLSHAGWTAPATGAPSAPQGQTGCSP